MINIITRNTPRAMDWAFAYGMYAQATLGNDNKEHKMDFINRIQFSEQKESRDSLQHKSMIDIAKEIGLLRLAAAGMIGCACFFGFFWSMSLLWVGLGGAL